MSLVKLESNDKVRDTPASPHQQGKKIAIDPNAVVVIDTEWPHLSGGLLSLEGSRWASYVVQAARLNVYVLLITRRAAYFQPYLYLSCIRGVVFTPGLG